MPLPKYWLKKKKLLRGMGESLRRDSLIWTPSRYFHKFTCTRQNFETYKKMFYVHEVLCQYCNVVSYQEFACFVNLKFRLSSIELCYNEFSSQVRDKKSML